MTDLENYAMLLDGIFGHGSAKFNTIRDSTNNVIGALNHPTDYLAFKNNFTARLHRLKNIYKPSSGLKEIIVQANQIADKKNWDGAFAELATFDHFNQDILKAKTWIHTPITPNITINVEKTFGKELGKSEANLDGFVQDRPLYFDVKIFKDNVAEILQGIYTEVCKHFKIKGLHITAERALDISYDDFQKKRSDLLTELKSSIDIKKQTTFIKSKVIPNLNYRLLWKPGITVTDGTYNPYQHALNFHKILFNYVNKFVKNEKTIIVLVTFPWYNGIVTDFRNNNVLLYRAMSRRIFCQYTKDNTPFKNFNSSFTGAETMSEISQYLSGIIFLEDKTILSKEPDKTNVNSYVYLNPNAKNPIPRSLSEDFLRGLHNTEFDNFNFDNY